MIIKPVTPSTSGHAADDGDTTEAAQQTAPSSTGTLRRLLMVAAVVGVLSFVPAAAAQAAPAPHQSGHLTADVVAPLPSTASSTYSHAAARSVADRGLTLSRTNCSYYSGSIVSPYECAQESLATPYAGCIVQVGDHYRPNDGWAQGAAWIGCPGAHTYRILLYLDYATTQGGRNTTIEENVSGTPIYGYGENITTGSACGGSSLWWTTFMRISIDGSAYSNYFTSQYGQYKAGAC